MKFQLRKFYQVYAPSISQTLFAKSETDDTSQKSQTLSSESKKGQTLSDLFTEPQKNQALFSQSYQFTLSWSHYLILTRIQNPDERRFYEIEGKRRRDC